jgi:hypothetical protein
VAKRVCGTVIKAARGGRYNGMGKGKGKGKAAEGELGLLVLAEALGGGRDAPEELAFRAGDFRFGFFPREGDGVMLNVLLEKRTGRRLAVDVHVVAASPTGREQGVVESVQDTFGFIDGLADSGCRKVFFHQSNVLRAVDGAAVAVGRGDQVEYDVDDAAVAGGQQQKVSAVRVALLPPGSIVFEQTLAPGLAGLLARVPRDAARRAEGGGRGHGGRVEEHERRGRISFEVAEGAAETAVFGLDDLAGARPDPLAPAAATEHAAERLYREGATVRFDLARDRRDASNVRFARRVTVVWAAGTVVGAPKVCTSAHCLRRPTPAELPRTGQASFGMLSSGGGAEGAKAEDSLKFHHTEQLPDALPLQVARDHGTRCPCLALADGRPPRHRLVRR